MKILVRLPNWLGDMVMSAGALRQLSHFFPGAEVSVIAKKGIHELLEFFPATQHQFIFNKEEYSGWKGLWQFGKQIKQAESFDLFFSFPDSFSSAFIGYATGAKNRVGYKKEGRNFLLTHAYTKTKSTHRVEEYVQLLEMYTTKQAAAIEVRLEHQFAQEDHIVININSEASSRRLTIPKAVEIITAVKENYKGKIVLIGGKNEQPFVEEVMQQLPHRECVQSFAGKTSLKELCGLLASAKLVLTTDSGPAHLANALGTQTVVLFGAGNENNTAPYNKQAATTIRLGKLSCEPCTKNICVQFETPQCLELLETNTILSAIKERMHGGF